MATRYDQYCPIAHALELVGERWALLVVRELMRGPKRYTDLAGSLGIGTNILAARLRDLEGCGVIAKRKLPPPASAQVYDLTDYGHQLKGVIRELAVWGARSLGPPTGEHELFPGWLVNALDAVLAPVAPPGRFEFRVGDEIASLVDGEARSGPVERPDVIVEGDPKDIYYLFVDGRQDLVSIAGDVDLLRRLVDMAPAPVEQPLAH
jgi:DNA-binding HxlR family transcriptional regulator